MSAQGMALSHELIGPIILQAFEGCESVLNKAAKFCAEHSISEAELLNLRLYPDMHPLIWQVQMLTEFSARAVVRLSGKETDALPSLAFEETSFAELIDRIDRARKIVTSVTDDDLSGINELDISMPFGPDQTLDISGPDYLAKLLIPNLHFHFSMTYALLRSTGVELGKRDYLGNV